MYNNCIHIYNVYIWMTKPGRTLRIKRMHATSKEQKEYQLTISTVNTIFK